MNQREWVIHELTAVGYQWRADAAGLTLVLNVPGGQVIVDPMKMEYAFMDEHFRTIERGDVRKFI